MSDQQPFAFVLMPFKKEFDDIYQFGIKQLCAEKGVAAERVDEQRFSENVLDRIYRQIESCDFIIADMTGQNANVFYEVGFAHAKGKLCILCANTADEIPFDLKHHNHVIYGGSATALKTRLANWLDWAKEETKKRKNASLNVSVRPTGEVLTKEKWRHTGTFDLLIKLQNLSGLRSDEIDAIYLKTLKEWELTVHGKPCASEIDPASGIKRSFIAPVMRYLSPGTFFEERIQFSRGFWSNFSGEEEKNSYRSTGTLIVEIVTEKATLTHELPLSVEFKEFPF
jgi:nucleoside 2-deoxyribosyltransferase